jgi:hypothetical protein
MSSTDDVTRHLGCQDECGRHSRATKRHRMEATLGAAAIQPTPDDLREIDRAPAQMPHLSW